MTDVVSLVAALRRPPLLTRAARLGQAEYSRTRDLRRLMRTPVAPTPEKAVATLLAEEQELEATRQSGAAGYNLLRHIEVLIAMVAETRLLARSQAAT